jgi:hypothetical protein
MVYLGHRGLEGNTTAGIEWKASSGIILRIHGISVYGLSIAVNSK